MSMSRKERIDQCLRHELKPEVLDIQDESHRHHVPEGAESHYKITLVSDAFSQQARIARHRRVNQLLAGEFERGLHALSLFLYTPQEWQSMSAEVPDSPPCRGGHRHG